MSDRIIGRLQTPVDSNGVRYDVHPITDAKAVIYDDDNTLYDKIQRLEPTLSEEKPSTPGFWFQPLYTETEDGDLVLKQLPTDEVTGKIKVDEVRNATIIDSSKIIVSQDMPDPERAAGKIWAQEILKDGAASDGGDSVLLAFKKDTNGNYVGTEDVPYNYDSSKVIISENKPEKPGLWLQDLGREIIEEE